MINALPTYVSIIMVLATIIALYLFYKIIKWRPVVIAGLLFWLIVQAVLAVSGFYTITDRLPPRVLFMILPPLVLIIGIFVTNKGKAFADSLDIERLTYFHTIRIAIEIILYLLFIYHLVPELMTFKGKNFDILSGITAPLIAWLMFSKRYGSRWLLMSWNIVCLGLLLNVVVRGILSVQYPFQQFGFEQPNIAVLYFPFVWIPGFIVPLVLFAHLAAIRQLVKKSF